MSRDNKIRLIFYFIWVTLLLLQAGFSELTADEAYYWMYSKKLAWGYFDHPPVIAVLAKLGYAILPNELGLRLFPILMVTGVIAILERIIKPRKLVLFYLFVFSVVIINVLGVLIIPDLPFLFFTALFLLLYSNYLKHPNLLKSLLMGVIAALMLLSKYHAFLVLILILASNLKLLKSKYVWFMMLVTSILCLPHLLWQITNDFPSINYHLVKRHDKPSLTFFLEYISSQPFVLGPITGILFFISVFKYKSGKNDFERSLKYLFFGIYLFFLLVSLRSRVEGHWTLFALLPGLYFSYKYYSKKNTKSIKRVKLLLYLSIPLVLIAKSFMIFDFLPNTNQFQLLKDQYHNKEAKVKLVKAIAKNHPVIFINDYQFASIYNFYTASNNAISTSSAEGRKSQYNLWNDKEKLRGKSVFYFPNLDINLTKEKTYDKSKYYYIKNYQTYDKISLTLDKKRIRQPLQSGKNETFKLKINSHYDKKISFTNTIDNNTVILLAKIFSGKKKVFQTGNLLTLNDNMINSIQEVTIKIPPDLKGEFTLHFSIRLGIIPSSTNSPQYNITIL